MVSRSRSVERPREQENQQKEAREPRPVEEQRDKKRSEVRIPKIQYRFLKEMDERRLDPHEVDATHAMVKKIRQYPLEERHVMAAWEKFTQKAIDDWKAGRGDQAERDAQHRAFSVVFGTLRGGPARTDQELKHRVDLALIANARLGVEPSRERATTQAKEQTQRELVAQGKLPLEPPRAKPRDDGGASDARGKQVAKDVGALRSRERRDPRAIQDRAAELIEKLRPKMEGATRELVELQAREWIDEGRHTRASATKALPRGLEALKLDRSEAITLTALTLATIARTPDSAELMKELHDQSAERRTEIVSEARARLERYPPLESGVSLVRRDQVAAAVRDVLERTPESRREALVFAHALSEIESAVARPDVIEPRRARMTFEELAADMVSDPA